MNEQQLLLEAVAGRVLCIDEICLRSMLAEIPTRMRASIDPREIEARARGGIAMTNKGGTVAVVPIYGVIEKAGGIFSYFFGGTSPDFLAQQISAAASDPNIEAIILDIDSPGGAVAGVDELAQEIYAARKAKPVTAVSNSLMASAAYYLGSQAGEVMVSPSSLTGSIGVYTLHQDVSRYLDNLGVKMTQIKYGDHKNEANSFEPLTSDARDHIQEIVDEHGAAFDKAVARGRGVTADDVRKRFGQGRIYTAQKAVKMGLADRVGTLDDALAKHGAKRPSMTRASDSFLFFMAAAAGSKKTKRVDGEDLPLENFAYQGDPDKTELWHLPIKFSTEEKTKKHIRDAVSRWDQTEMPDKAEKERARGRIRKAAKEHGIELSDGDLKGEMDSSVSASARRRELDLLAI